LKKDFFDFGKSILQVLAVNLQDKQDKHTATTAKICKNDLRGLIGCGATIYLLSEAIWPLFEVATLTGWTTRRGRGGRYWLDRIES
jgi:hypothetical protein